MPRTSYGTEKRDQAWHLINLLLNARGTSLTQRISIDGAEIAYKHWDNDKNSPSISVKASLISLSKLSEDTLNGEQIREAINEHLGNKFLGILEDRRTQKAGRGAEVWKFEITLWSTDVADNHSNFLKLWEQKKYASNQTLHSESKEELRKSVQYKVDGKSELLTKHLTNFLEPYERLVKRLVDTAEERFPAFPVKNLSDVDIKKQALEVVLEISDSKSVFLFSKKDRGVWKEVARAISTKSDSYLSTVESVVIPSLEKKSFSKESHGCIIEFNGTIHTIIPVKGDRRSQYFVCICDVLEDSLSSGEPFGEIISTFLSMDLRLVSSSLEIEAYILDGLKRAFNFVSPYFYRRRFDLFKNRLKNMTVNYQPIVKLNPLVLEAWEALARDPDTINGNDSSTMVAPVDLFRAAELWGVEFTTELDLYFLKKATHKYRQLRDAAKLQRFHDTLPLSVNVYPSSVLRTAYLNEVKELTKSNVIPAGKLILEISEKSSLPDPPYWSDDVMNWSSFKRRLKTFVREVPGIRFAIDDFGVGHASVSRLVGLNLEYVKIDREVLDYAKDVRDKIIKFVRDALIEAGNYSPNIIVEGVDKEYPIRLNNLLDIGAQSIQGYIVDKPRSQIYDRLSEEQFSLLRAQLT